MKFKFISIALMCFILFNGNLFPLSKVNDICSGEIEIKSYYKFGVNDTKSLMKYQSKGLLFGDEGYIVTAFHNIRGAVKVFANITLPSGEIRSVTLYPTKSIYSQYYWIDEQRDLVIFKIEGLFLSSHITLDTDEPQLNDTLYTLLNNELIPTGKVTNFVDIYLSRWISISIGKDTPLKPGEAVFSKNGKVLGIVLYRKDNEVFVITSESIVNTKLQLDNYYGNQFFKKQIDDYLITPDIYANLLPIDSLDLTNR